MSAEEIFNKWVETRPIGTVPQTFDKDYVLNKENAIIFAKAYYQSRVDAEMLKIIQHHSEGILPSQFPTPKIILLRWVKRQLLKQ